MISKQLCAHGDMGFCKLCKLDWNASEAGKASNRVARAKWRAKNPDYHRVQSLKMKYGLTQQDFDDMLTAQDGKCAICLQHLIRGNATHIDHDHVTDKVRELLCQTCNHGIGSLMDSIDITERALAYLRKHKAA